MNNEHDLDRLIDEAARQMAQHEPSDALSDAVMARISARATSLCATRVMWRRGSPCLAMAALVIAMVSGSRLRAPGSGPQTSGAGLRTSTLDLGLQTLDFDCRL